MLEYKPNIILTGEEYKVLGTNPLRHDATDKVTGRARFGADIQIPGLLSGKILRSPHPHAIINSIDITEALNLEGVKAIATSKDFPETSDKVSDVPEGELRNIGFLSANCLARGKALYKGHAIAAVAATSPEIAEEALSLIKVDYEVLQPVLNATDAMKPDAPALHDRLMTVTQMMGPGGTKDEDGGQSTNVGKTFVMRLGDPEEGFKNADLIIEREFKTVAVHQGYIEPHTSTAFWGPDNKLTIWSSSQGQFAVREQTAKIVGLPISQVKAVPMEIGGGFGGKLTVYVEPVAAILSQKSGQPVKVTMSRTEVFIGSGPTSGTQIKVKIGATKEGKITAAQAHLVYEAGAFPGSPVAGGARCMFAPYDIPNAEIEAVDVVINAPKVAAYRAPGAPAAAFAVEQVVDELSQQLDIDPIEFRLTNASKEGTRQTSGPTFGPIGNIQVLEAAKQHPHYHSDLGGPNRGRGVASGYWGNGGGPASAIASVHPDGKVSLIEGSPDIGGTRTTAAMQFAEVLGIPPEDVNPSVGDTDSIGFTSPTGGSSVTFKTGWACYTAALDVKRQMIDRAARIWEVEVDQVEYTDGALHHKSDPELKLSFQELAAKLNSTGGPIVGRATIDERRTGPAFAHHIVDVEVDTETGKVSIIRYTAIQDVGKAIHPTYVEGQIQGGVVQGIGWALNEEYAITPDGHMMNSNFLDYRMPTSLDLPMIDTVIVEVTHPGHPFGVRGVAELPLVPPMAAIANAIHNATGLRMTELPMAPPKVLERLQSK